MQLSLRVLLLNVIGLWCGTARAHDVDLTSVFDVEFTPAGMCFHNGKLYAVSKFNKLAVYDPQTGEQLEVVDPLVPGLGEDLHIHELTHGAADTFWVGETTAGRLYQMRFSDDSLVSFVQAPAGGATYGLAFDGDLIWVGHHSPGPATSIQAVDPDIGIIVETMAPGTADVHGLEWAGGYLWVLDNSIDVLFKVDRSGAVLDAFVLPDLAYSSLAFDGTDFWTSSGNIVWRVGLPAESPGPLRAADDRCDGGTDAGATCTVAADCPGGACGSKNRYVSFSIFPYAVPGSTTQAIRVTFSDVAGFTGRTRWVGAPAVFEDTPTPLTAAPLQCQPHFMDWRSLGLVHVHGNGIMPGSTYDVQMISVEADPANENDYSTALTIDTAVWGDVAAPFAGTALVSQPDFNDVFALVNKFKSKPGAPIKPRAQLQPGDPDPGSPVGFMDILSCVEAFRGFTFPFAGPPDCP